MKTFLKKYKTWLITFSFLYLYLLFILVFPTSYSGITPYSLNDVSKNIIVENDTNINNETFYSISVISISRVTPLQKMILDSIDAGETYRRSEYYDVLSSSDISLQGQIDKEYSYFLSIINAYNQAKLINENINISYTFVGAKIYYIPKNITTSSKINIGDTISGVIADNVTYDSNNITTLDDVSAFVNLFTSNNLTLIKDGNYINIDQSNTNYKLAIRPIFNIITSPSILLPGLSSTTGGPSGGLLQTLYIYTKLLNIDLSSYKISGTGTITLLGNVGTIGGAKEKFICANKSNADIFFIPNSNYDDIESVKDKYTTSQVVVVSTFTEALTKLSKIVGVSLI